MAHRAELVDMADVSREYLLVFPNDSVRDNVGAKDALVILL